MSKNVSGLEIIFSLAVTCRKLYNIDGYVYSLRWFRAKLDTLYNESCTEI
jgi:hypothetical protein